MLYLIIFSTCLATLYSKSASFCFVRPDLAIFFDSNTLGKTYNWYSSCRYMNYMSIIPNMNDKLTTTNEGNFLIRACKIHSLTSSLNNERTKFSFSTTWSSRRGGGERRENKYHKKWLINQWCWHLFCRDKWNYFSRKWNKRLLPSNKCKEQEIIILRTKKLYTRGQGW